MSVLKNLAPYLKLHLNMDTLTNGSTTIVDQSPTVKTITASNNACLKTDVKKFGLSSCYFDGVNDYITATYHADFNLGANDFTISLWVYITAMPGTYGYFLLAKPSNSNGSIFEWQCGIAQDGRITFGGSTVTTSNDSNFDTLVGTFNSSHLNKWQHLEFSRKSGTFYTFFNGKKKATLIKAATLYASTQPITFGTSQYMLANYPSATDFTGYMDDVIILNGHCLHNQDFEVPERAFSLKQNLLHQSMLLDNSLQAASHTPLRGFMGVG